MAESSLIIRIDGKDAERAASRLEKSLKDVDSAGGGASKSVTGVGKSSKTSAAQISGATTAFRALTTAAIAFVSVGVGRAVFDTVTSFQSLKAQIKTFVGDAELASGAFDALNEFASQTPFNLEQSINAFTKMMALGLRPTEEALVSFGNTASAMGKDLNQMIEAIADASTSEFERLKEFGIKAKKQGDEVKFTFQGITTTVKNNSEDIVRYLTDIGQTNFATAMSDQMATLRGQVSNLEDSWNKLKYALGQKLEETTFLADLASELDSIRDNLSIYIAGWELFVADAIAIFGSFVTSFEISVIKIDKHWTALTALLKYKWQQTMEFFPLEMANAFESMESLARTFGFDEFTKHFGGRKDAIRAENSESEKTLIIANAQIKAFDDRIESLNREFKIATDIAARRQTEYQTLVNQGKQIDENNKKIDDFIPKKKKEDKQEEFTVSATKAINELEDYIVSQEQAAEAIGRTDAQVEKLNLQWKITEALLATNSEAERLHIELLAEQAEKYLNLTIAAEKDNELKERAAELIKEARTEQQEYNALVEELGDLKEKEYISDEQYLVLMKNLNSEFDELIDKRKGALEGIEAGAESYLNSIGSEYEALKGTSEKVFQGMEDALIAFTLNGKKNFSDMVNAIVADITRLAIQQSIMKPLSKMFLDDQPGSGQSAIVGFATTIGNMIFGGAGTSIGTGVGATSTGGATTVPTPTVISAANGARAMAGKPYLIGEREPELFVPDVSGEIVPRSRGSRSGGFGDTTNVYLGYPRDDASKDRDRDFGLSQDQMQASITRGAGIALRRHRGA